MSRYRNIHCKIWMDDKFPFVSDDCQLVFFHLLTTPLSSPFGLFRAGIASLAEEKRWPVERYSEAFGEAFRKGFVKHDERHLIVFIPRFVEYNKPNNPNVLRSWVRAVDEFPNCDLKTECIQALGEASKASESLRKAFMEAFGKPLERVSPQEQYQEQYQEQEVREDPPEAPPLKKTGAKKNAQATQIPQGFEVTADMLAWWHGKQRTDIDVHCETDIFCDYWRGTGGTKKDWVATWRTWMLKEIKRKPTTGGNGSAQHRGAYETRAAKGARKEREDREQRTGGRVFDGSARRVD